MFPSCWRVSIISCTRAEYQRCLFRNRLQLADVETQHTLEKLQSRLLCRADGTTRVCLYACCLQSGHGGGLTWGVTCHQRCSDDARPHDAAQFREAENIPVLQVGVMSSSQNREATTERRTLYHVRNFPDGSFEDNLWETRRRQGESRQTAASLAACSLKVCMSIEQAIDHRGAARRGGPPLTH